MEKELLRAIDTLEWDYRRDCECNDLGVHLVPEDGDEGVV